MQRPLSISPHFDKSNQLRLVEVDGDLLALLTAPKSDDASAAADERRPKRARPVMIKGDKLQALLCTDDKTYQIRRAEFSNSLLVVEGGRIIEKAPYLFETARARAHVEVAMQLLAENYIQEDELEGRAPPPSPAYLLTLDALRRIVPADKAALSVWLREHGAIVQGPFVRLLHPRLEEQYLESVMHLLEARVKMLEDGLAVDEILTHLGGSLDSTCLLACLSKHGAIARKTARAAADTSVAAVVDETATAAAVDWWSPSVEAVAATLAKPILEREEVWRCDSFFTELSRKFFLLSGLSPAHLRGHATTVGPNLVHFERDALPFEPLARLHAMFKLKQRWQLIDVEAYIGPLGLKGNDLAGFIGKHCREHKDHKGTGAPVTFSLA